MKKLLKELIHLFAQKGIPEDRLREQILFTPSCGMGSGTLSSEESRLALELLAQLV